MTLAAERAIHFAMFILILIGLGAVSAWASYTYLNDTLILEIAGIALSWGVALLVLYVGFKKLDWDWWS
jgi:glycerol uptake facilitator-like aquaporin